MTTPHYEDKSVRLFHGDCLDVLRDIPDASVDAVCTDPPYGLANTDPRHVEETLRHWMNGERDYLPGGKGFMGKAWDAFVPPVAVWDECLRVLRPGGHCLAFAGSRTVDLMTLGIRLAGFDVRDSIAWLYGSGFPKSRDVSDAMEAWINGEEPLEGPGRAIRPGVYTVTGFLRRARDKAGWSNAQIDALFGTNGMSGHWVSQGSQPAVPSVRQWEVLKERLGFGDDVDDLVEQLAASERPEDWGTGDGGDEEFLGTLRKDGDYEHAGGWGTALKPAFEPIVVGRKPVVGSTTANVRAYGTGALNIDGCRSAMSDEDRAKFERGMAAWKDHSERYGGQRADGSGRKAASIYGEYGIAAGGPHAGGRWPSNVVLDPTQARDVNLQAAGTDDGAAKYFPVFRYTPKASTVERPVVNGTAHPTVKPLDLMRWLVRLVTPPGGTVLEPFAGSGTTVEACLAEGFRCVAIEKTADYLPLILSRVHRRTNPAEAIRLAGGDLGLFGVGEDAS